MASLALPLKEQLKAGRQAAIAEFQAGGKPESLLAQLRHNVDIALTQAWQTYGMPSSSALVAVGGYGRGELFPQSDIDLLVLAGTSVKPSAPEALARFFALLWDAGLPVGHAVRTLDECTQAAADDLTVMTSLIEARPLVASPENASELLAAVSVDKVWPARAFFHAKREEFRQRHARFGDTATLELQAAQPRGVIARVHLPSEAFA